MRKATDSELWSGDPKVMRKKNPDEITRGQHIFPNAAINRFTNKNGKVKVVPANGGKTYLVAPDNARFTVERLWDQKCENNSNKLYEEPFHLLVKKLLDLNTRQLDSDEGTIASRMYGLWRARTRLKRNPLEDQILTCLLVPPNTEGLSQSEGEKLENAGLVIMQEITSEGHPIVRSRFVVWPKLHLEVKLFETRYKSYNWAIFNDNTMKFVIPDECPETISIPLSPTRCLAVMAPNSSFEKLSTISISEKLKSAAKEYWIEAP